MFSRNFVPLLLQFPTTEKSLWINTYTCRSYFYSQLVLLLQDTPRILCAYCLAVPCHLNTPTDNFSPLSSIRSSPVVHVFHNGLWNTIWTSKNLEQPKFLLACIMVNPISLIILLAFLSLSFWFHWYNVLRMHAILNQILEFILLAQTSF